MHQKSEAGGDKLWSRLNKIKVRRKEEKVEEHEEEGGV